MRFEFKSGRLPGARWVLPMSLSMAVVGTVQAAATASFGELEGSFVSETAGEALQRGAVVGDVNKSGKPDLAIGSPLNDAGGTDAGRVYLFLEPGTGGSVGRNVNSANVVLTGEAGSQLGARVVGGQDLTGDGLPELVVTAPGWNSGTGRVYVFFGRTDWTGVTLASANLVITGDQAGQQLGGGVLLPGDINGDGRQDLVIASPGRDDSSTARDRGAVYLFLGNTFGWDTRALNTADAIYRGEGNGDGLGSAIAALNDVNGDNLADWAVSSPRNDATATDAGELYVFLGRTDYVLGDTGVSGVASVRYRGDASGDLFGASIAGGGDLNGDGNRDILAGSPMSDFNGADSGRVYTIAGRKLQWPLTPTVASEGSIFSFFGVGAGDRLGDADGLALAEASGDGLADAWFFSRTVDANGADSGALYLFRGRSSGWGTSMNVGTADLLLTGDAAGDGVGVVDSSGLGDLDGDSRFDALVGAPGSDLAGPDGGEVYVANNVARWLDQDGDGYAPVDGDCDDFDAEVNPGVTTDGRDNVDNDCDGQIDEDASSGCSSLTLNERGFGPHGAGSLLGLGLVSAVIARRRRSSR